MTPIADIAPAIVPTHRRADGLIGELAGARTAGDRRRLILPAGIAALSAAMVMVVAHSLELYVSLPIALLSAAVMGLMSVGYLVPDEDGDEADPDAATTPAHRPAA